jgi:predicted amidohydrolase
MLLATAQSRIEKNPDENAAQIAGLIRQAAEAGADFVHFPECALSGYVKTQITDWSEVDWRALARHLQGIRELCAKLTIGAAIGSAHKSREKDRPFNSLYIIDSAGSLAARYDKRLCSNSEITDWFSAGTAPVVVDVKGMKLGFALCIEIQFPEVFLAYERMGANCVLLSAYHDAEIFRIQAQGHAACNNYWISYSVPANASHRQPSCCIGPYGSVLDSCGRDTSGFVLSTIDPDAAEWDIPCKKARPWRALARQGDIYK